MSRRILVVGGAGAFGSRLVRGLLNTTDLKVVVGGREPSKADPLLAEAPPGRAEFARLDTTGIAPETLRSLGCFAVVDAAGPFQGADHRLARAAISAGMHYVDLADGRDFVASIGNLDEAARKAGILVLTGASSTPALSHAVLDEMTAGWRRIDRVAVTITPGNRAPRGLSVMQAILSYVGRPVRVFTQGQWQTRPGWGMTVHADVEGLGKRWFSLCETPDLDLLPQRFAIREEAVFRAGLELPLLHLGLWAASLPVRAGLIPSLAPLARIFQAAATLVEKWGTDRGGMMVEAEGADAGDRPISRRWILIAESGDGPVIPTLPALAIVRRLADGQLARPGAGPCVGLLNLAAITAEFAPYRITARYA